MPFLELAAEILTFIFHLHLADDNGLPHRDLLLPADRLAHHIDWRRNSTHAEYPPCLTASIPEERALSLQASTCAEEGGSLPRIFQLCHICSSIRSMIMGAPQLWAAQALCWPAHSQTILPRAGACSLRLVSTLGLCACVFHDIRPFLHRATTVGLILPSSYLRTDGADLSASSLVRAELVRASLLTDLQIRFDGHGRQSSEAVLVTLPHLRSARLQNADFIPAGSRLQLLHIATEPEGPKLSLEQLLAAILKCPNIRELVVQNTVQGEIQLPWAAGVTLAARIALTHLEHLTCSGPQGLVRALLYWVDVPEHIDLHVDADFLLGTTPRPFDRFPSELARDLCALLHPVEIFSLLECVRLHAEDPTSYPASPKPEVPQSYPLPYLALNIIPDSEAKRPMEMWPRMITVAAAEDKEGAIRGLLPKCDPVSLGPGRMRRIFTMRNFHTSFPVLSTAATRESFPRSQGPTHLGLATSLPLTAYVLQAEADEVIVHLTLGPMSWVPRNEDEWLFVLADLTRLRFLEVLSEADSECVRSLAAYLWREGANEDLREIAFRNLGSPNGIHDLEQEVNAMTVRRETANEEESLPHIVWSLD